MLRLLHKLAQEQSVASPYPLANIISEYKFEDNTNDTVGSNNGTATGVSYVTDMVSKAGSFGSSSSSYVTISDSDDLSFTDGVTDLPFSTTFLIKFSSFDNTNGLWVINKRDDSAINSEYQITFKDGFNIFLFKKTSPSDHIRRSYVFTPTLNQIYHLTATYDGSETHAGIKLYLDGVSVGTSSLSGTYTGMSNTSSPVEIGKRGWESPSIGSSSYRLDCVRFWNKELTAAEALDIATAELAGTDINP